MTVPLPKGAGTPKTNEESDLSVVADQNQSDPGIKDAIAAVADEDNQEVQYPSLPEITEMGDDLPSFVDRVIPNFKALMTSDDLGKTEIFKNAFEDDERWGGAFVDDFGLPIIVMTPRQV